MSNKKKGDEIDNIKNNFRNDEKINGKKLKIIKNSDNAM